MYSKFFSKYFSVLFVLLFSIFYFLFFTAYNVSAQRIDTPASDNIINVIPPETVNLITGEECPASRMGGLVGNTLTSLERIVTIPYSEAAPKLGLTCSSPELKEQRIKSFLNGETKFDDSINLLGLVNNVNSFVIAQKPTSGIWFLETHANALLNFQNVSAQTAEPSQYYPGPGYDLLTPIFSFWGWGVNVAFAFIILFIIFIAFAISFPTLFGAKQIVELKSAIPNVALALILIPFSYAISGAMIDIMTLGLNVVHGFLLGPGAPGYTVYQEALNDIGEKCNDVGSTDCNRGLYADDWRVSVFNIFQSLDFRRAFIAAAESLDFDKKFSIFQFIATFLNFFLDEEGATGKYDAGISAWVGAIINLVLSVLMLFYGIRIALILIARYVTMILYPILSPFIFASVAIPGNGTKSVFTYLKTLFACGLDFVVVYAILLLIKIFNSAAFASNLPNLSAIGFTPPLFGHLATTISSFTTGVNYGSGLAAFIFTLLSLGLYFSIPAILKNIDDRLKVQTGIPKFLSTPIAGLRESVEFTRSSLKTVKVGGTNVFKGSRSLSRQSIDVYSSFQKNVLGIDENKTAKAKIVQSAIKNIGNLEKKLKDPSVKNNPVRVAQINARIAANKALLDFRVKDADKALGKVDDEKKRLSISVEGNTINSQFVQLVLILNGSFSDEMFRFALKVSLSGENFEFTDRPNLSMATIDDNGNLGEKMTISQNSSMLFDKFTIKVLSNKGDISGIGLYRSDNPVKLINNYRAAELEFLVRLLNNNNANNDFRRSIENAIPEDLLNNNEYFKRDESDKDKVLSIKNINISISSTNKYVVWWDEYPDVKSNPFKFEIVFS